MNLFDGLQNAMFGTVTNTMGYLAVWTPSDGGPQQTAKVLYSGPTEKEKIYQVDFDADKLTMEYQLGDLTGLKELVDNNKTQPISIYQLGDGTLIEEFKVKSVTKRFDGKTFEARLQRR